MAKKEDKRLGDDPFERFLPQIQDSRKKKDDDASADESVSATESKSADKNTSKSESKNTSTRTSKNTNKSNDISENESKSASNGKSENEITDAGESKNKITSTVASESAYESDGATAIKIARKNKNTGYVKMTHYFRPDQLEAIETLHKESGRDKSELVRLAVDILIRQAKVE